MGPELAQQQQLKSAMQGRACQVASQQERTSTHSLTPDGVLAAAEERVLLLQMHLQREPRQS